jgi:hypothetical protein
MAEIDFPPRVERNQAVPLLTPSLISVKLINQGKMVYWAVPIDK